MRSLIRFSGTGNLYHREHRGSQRNATEEHF
jgi:hypothetical protein